MPDNLSQLSLAHAAAPGPMPRNEYGHLLNSLLEAERAGAKLLAAYMNELPPDSVDWAALSALQRDEARNCSVLIHLLLEAGIEPTMTVGAFHRKGLAIAAWRERLEFLNRGQGWVAKRIAAALPRISEVGARAVLRTMRDSHLANIDICERLLA